MGEAREVAKGPEERHGLGVQARESLAKKADGRKIHGREKA